MRSLVDKQALRFSLFCFGPILFLLAPSALVLFPLTALNALVGIFDGFAWNFKDKDLKARFAEQFTMGDLDYPLTFEKVFVSRERPAKELFYIPALLLLGLIIFLQKRRHRHYRPEEKAAAV